jgi:hypothetical protein
MAPGTRAGRESDGTYCGASVRISGRLLLGYLAQPLLKDLGSLPHACAQTCQQVPPRARVSEGVCVPGEAAFACARARVSHTCGTSNPWSTSCDGVSSVVAPLPPAAPTGVTAIWPAPGRMGVETESVGVPLPVDVDFCARAVELRAARCRSNRNFFTSASRDSPYL